MRSGGSSVLVDAHIHLDMLAGAWETAVAHLRQHHIFTLSVSTTPAAYRQAQTLTANLPGAVPLFGVHPWEAANIDENFTQLDPYIAETPMLGEIGLDFLFFKDPAHRRRQEQLFDYFLDAAERQGKMVNLHATGAEKHVLRRLEAHALPGAILHWYAGPVKLVERFLAAGAYFSFGPGVIFDDKVQRVLTAVPPTRILSETDAPDAYRVYTQEEGTPGHLPAVVAAIAAHRGWTAEEATAQIATNFTEMCRSAPEIAEKWAVFTD